MYRKMLKYFLKYFLKRKNLRNNVFTLFLRFLPAKGVMPAAGLEPARGYPQQILSLHRLPFRHAGISSQRNSFYHIVFGFASGFGISSE